MERGVQRKEGSSFIYYMVLVFAYLLLAWGTYMYFEWRIKKLESKSGTSQEANERQVVNPLPAFFAKQGLD